MEKTPPHGEASWYAVSTRSRQESIAASMLGSLGIRHFLPRITEIRRWSDRKQAVSLPLFPSYLFVSIDRSCDTQLRVLRVPGIVKFIGNLDGPLAIPEEEIDSVRAVLSHRVEAVPYRFFEAGDRVRIVRGALAGIEGTFLRSGTDSKLIISIELIHRSLAIDIRGCDIERISPVPLAHGLPEQATLSRASRDSSLL